MIGRKLTERLIADGGLNGQAIDKLTLIDIVAPARPAGFTGRLVYARRRYLRHQGDREGGRGPARLDLPPGRDRVGRGGDRFRQGLPHQPDRHARSARSDPAHRRRLSPEGRLHLLDRGVRRAVPARDPRRFPPDAADVLRHPEGDRRIPARRLCRARASSTAWVSGCRRSACGPASRTPPPPASSPASSASRSPARRRSCR